MKQVLTLEQARAIHDAGYELPNNSNPLLCYVNHHQEEDIAWTLQVYDELFECLDEWCVTTYTVGELLQLFPIEIVDKVRDHTFGLTIPDARCITDGFFIDLAYKLDTTAYVSYMFHTGHIEVENTIDGLFDALIELKDILTRFPSMEAKY